MSVRIAAIRALIVLSFFGAAALTVAPSWAEERTVEEWIAILEDDDWKVRQRAAEALGQMKDSYALEPLTARLQDEVPEVRAQAAAALGALGDQYSVEPLIAALGDRVPSVRRQAATALAKITGQDFGEDPGSWLGWWEENQDLGGGY